MRQVKTRWCIYKCVNSCNYSSYFQNWKCFSLQICSKHMVCHVYTMFVNRFICMEMEYKNSLVINIIITIFRQVISHFKSHSSLFFRFRRFFVVVDVNLLNLNRLVETTTPFIIDTFLSFSIFSRIIQYKK